MMIVFFVERQVSWVEPAWLVRKTYVGDWRYHQQTLAVSLITCLPAPVALLQDLQSLRGMHHGVP